MNGVGVVVVGLLGLFVGSAVWAVSQARATERSLLGGVVCTNPACSRRLALWGWLPLLGFGLARRCAGCGAVQPSRRVVFELAVAIYYALATVRLADQPRQLVATLVFAVPLLNVLLVDAWTRFIHTDVIAVGLVLGLLFAVLDGGRALLGAILAALAAAALFGLFFVLATLIYRNVKVVPFGIGDVYLVAMIGTMVRGREELIQALFTGILLAGLASLVLLATRRVGRRDPIAYGPYLCLGALVTLVQ